MNGAFGLESCCYNLLFRRYWSRRCTYFHSPSSSGHSVNQLSFRIRTMNILSVIGSMVVFFQVELISTMHRASLLQTQPYSLGPNLSTQVKLSHSTIIHLQRTFYSITIFILQALFSLWLLLSPPAPYLSSLPTSYTCMYFTSPSHQALLPNHLRDCLLKQIALVDKDFKEVSEVVN